MLDHEMNMFQSRQEPYLQSDTINEEEQQHDEEDDEEEDDDDDEENQFKIDRFVEDNVVDYIGKVGQGYKENLKRELR